MLNVSRANSIHQTAMRIGNKICLYANTHDGRMQVVDVRDSPDCTQRALGTAESVRMLRHQRCCDGGVMSQ